MKRIMLLIGLICVLGLSGCGSGLEEETTAQAVAIKETATMATQALSTSGNNATKNSSATTNASNVAVITTTPSGDSQQETMPEYTDIATGVATTESPSDSSEILDIQASDESSSESGNDSESSVEQTTLDSRHEDLINLQRGPVIVLNWTQEILDLVDGKRDEVEMHIGAMVTTDGFGYYPGSAYFDRWEMVDVSVLEGDPPYLIPRLYFRIPDRSYQIYVEYDPAYGFFYANQFKED